MTDVNETLDLEETIRLLREMADLLEARGTANVVALAATAVFNDGVMTITAARPEIDFESLVYFQANVNAGMGALVSDILRARGATDASKADDLVATMLQHTNAKGGDA